tara:strand:+ start:541 stop:1299 length:759 start_codon:yes stop_codon:yes gene_type:complete
LKNIELFANISIGHENDFDVLHKRIVAAAQCNADAVVLSKSTPHLAIQPNKQYLQIDSKWGSLPYLEVAKRSEIDEENCEKVLNLIEQIGIPLKWSVTDVESALWVKRNTGTNNIKIHYDSRNDQGLVEFVSDNFQWITYGGNDKLIDLLLDRMGKPKYRKRVNLYHSTTKFPPQVEELNLDVLEKYKSRPHVGVGYEGRCEDIFPDCAVVFKNIDFIEKFLGDDDSTGAVLSPQKFYDFFVNMNQLEIANG